MTPRAPMTPSRRPPPRRSHWPGHPLSVPSRQRGQGGVLGVGTRSPSRRRRQAPPVWEWWGSPFCCFPPPLELKRAFSLSIMLSSCSCCLAPSDAPPPPQKKKKKSWSCRGGSGRRPKGGELSLARWPHPPPGLIIPPLRGSHSRSGTGACRESMSSPAAALSPSLLFFFFFFFWYCTS